MTVLLLSCIQLALTSSNKPITKMKRGSISSGVLVILALQLPLLLAGAGAQSMLADDQPAIRLPSDAKGAGNNAREGNYGQKPWGDCCDMAMCTRSWPPICRCTDEVESCSSACKDCEQVSSDPPRYVCKDVYRFDVNEAPFLIPKCK